MTNPTPIDQAILKNALRDALESVLEKGDHDPRTHFYHKFREEVAEHDEDLCKKYDDDLNATLTFTGLFSAIVSAFIIDIQSELTPDYEQLNNGLLELLLNVTVGNIPPGQAISLPRWIGPDPGVRQVQAVLYAALCTTFFAAFLATLGKQWLNRYIQKDTRGLIEDRCRERERKLRGVDGWWFDTVMQSAPLLIQSSLGLLGAALSQYLWRVDRVISSVIIGFTAFAFFLFVVIVTISVRHFNSPFQTPLSLSIRYLVAKHKTWREKNRPQVVTDLASFMGDGVMVSGAPFHASHHQVSYSSLSRLWERGYKLDARCIIRMLKMAPDMPSIRLTMAFVQEVVWGLGIEHFPLKLIYERLMACFDFPHLRTPTLIPGQRDMAYLSAKALAHIQIQRRYIRQPEGPDPGNWYPDTPHKRLSYPGSGVDDDLGSVLHMVDDMLRPEVAPEVTIHWDGYRLNPDHHLWVSNHYIYFAMHEPLSDRVWDFVKYSLDPDKPPSDAVITDCLYIINMMLGTIFHVGDLTRRDKSRHMNNIVDRIFQDLSKWFRNQAPLTNTSVEDLPFRVLKLITRVKINTVAARSYGLFETIMRPAVAQEKKMEAAPLALHMEAARLALHTAYPPGLESVPPVQDPSLILDFLRYHIDPNVKSEDRAHAIASAMRAIRSTSNGPLSQSWIWCIKNAGELLTRLQQSSGHWEEFKWWYMILWRYRGKLDASIWGRMDDIAKNGGDKIDLEECKVAIEKEIERVKGSGGAPDILKSLDDSCARLNELIDDREKLRPPVVPFI